MVTLSNKILDYIKKRIARILITIYKKKNLTVLNKLWKLKKNNFNLKS